MPEIKQYITLYLFIYLLSIISIYYIYLFIYYFIPVSGPLSGFRPTPIFSISVTLYSLIKKTMFLINEKVEHGKI